MTQRKVLFTGLFTMLLSTTATADPLTEVLGLWAGTDSIIEIRAEGDGLVGRVAALMEPNYVEGEPFGPVGAPRLDANNPDPDLQSRPILGLPLLDNYTFEDGRWQGEIYDPESGKTYTSRLKIDRDGNLAIRGYIGMPMLGRTAIFAPVARCETHMIEMLRKAELSECAAKIEGN